MNPNVFFFLFGFLFLLVISCDNKELPLPETPEFCNEIDEPFYDTSVGSIFNESCAYSGCHLNGGVAGSDYGTYQQIATYLSDNNRMASFRSKVLYELKDDPISGMPPNNSPIYPHSVKDDLTQDELEIIECWLDAGFPEN